MLRFMILLPHMTIDGRNYGFFYAQGKENEMKISQKKPQRYQGMFTFLVTVLSADLALVLVSASQLRDFVTRCVTLMRRVRVNIQVAYSSVKIIHIAPLCKSDLLYSYSTTTTVHILLPALICAGFSVHRMQNIRRPHLI